MASFRVVPLLAFALLSLSLQTGAAKRAGADPGSIDWDQHDRAGGVAATSFTEAIDHVLPTRDQAFSFVELNHSDNKEAKYSALDVACFCKEVDDESMCKDNKYRSNPQKPSGPRYFHSNVRNDLGEDVNLCCKLDWTSFFAWNGWFYTRQDDLTRCMRETRWVPTDSCCRLKDEHGQVGIRIRKATSESVLKKDGSAGNTPMFLKSPPEFSLEDITSGQDYTGNRMAAEEVREFVEMQLVEGGRFHGKLQCGGTRGSFEGLFADTGACHLRLGPSEQCCCHVASVVEAVRCLPVKGAAMEQVQRRQVLESTLQTWSKSGKMEGKIVDATAPDESAMPGFIKDMADPEMEDLDTQANVKHMLWDWVKANEQWTKICLETKQVPHVISTRKSKRMRAGKACTTVGGALSCRNRYRTKYWTEYSQGYTEECGKWQWDRKCPAGTGLYVKQINPGQCMKAPDDSSEDLVLTEIGPLMYECPVDYASGNGGTGKFDPHCGCNGQCSQR